MNGEPRARRGDWMQTYSGRQFWPLDPKPEEVDIEDIAHALGMQCRFNGHCSRFYSVAQHSIHVSLLVPPRDALWGLMHDAGEAYLGDMIRPIKTAEFRFWEDGVLAAIAERFDLPWPPPQSIRLADDTALATEARDIMLNPPAPWGPLPEPDTRVCVLGDPEGDYWAFLERFYELREDCRR